MKTIRIALLAYDGCMGMEIFGIADTLLIANRVAQALGGQGKPPLFDVSVVSLAGGEVTAAGGIGIATVRAARRQFDLLVVPGMELADPSGCLYALPRLAPEIAFIARVFARGRPVAALCVGAFLLGEAGLLDARRATTSWLFGAELARRFPQAGIDTDAMLVEDGGVTTTGSFTATFDLALHLVGKFAPPRIQRAVARMGLIDGDRASQAPYVDVRMLPAPADTFSARVAAWMTARLAAPYELGSIAAAFHVSGRTLLRRFKDETGMTPLAHLQQARIARARLLLESGADSVAQVTEKVGYGDVATFGALFKRLVGHSPAQYRRRFRTAGAQR